MVKNNENKMRKKKILPRNNSYNHKAFFEVAKTVI